MQPALKQASSQISGGLLLQGAPRTPLLPLGGYSICLIIVGIYEFGPITAGTMPGENNTFTTHVDPVSPP